MEDQENTSPSASPPAGTVPVNQSPGLEPHTVNNRDNDTNVGGDFLPGARNISQRQERLCDPFLEKFAGIMNHDNISSVLEEQKHMYVFFRVHVSPAMFAIGSGQASQSMCIKIIVIYYI